MAKHVAWDREQLLTALRLYMGMPFGKLHGRNPQIISLARQIGRTSNALAMKACNFASLDPAFLKTTRSGLSGASNADPSLWNEFSANPESIAAEMEEVYSRNGREGADSESVELRAPLGDTELRRFVRARRVQSFFRMAVLNSYSGRCAISGLGESELLVASHIIPWSVSVERRADPTNGICLNALFDRAFDRGLITVNADMQIVVSGRLKNAAMEADLSCSLVEADGQRLSTPWRLPPAEDALAYHRSNVFCG